MTTTTTTWKSDDGCGFPAPPVKDIPVSTSKLGGLLEPFADVGKGWRILKPYGWNQFDTRPGVYEEKWTDIVAANQQNLLVTTVPVKSTTTRVDALVGRGVQGGGQARGEAAAVGGRRRVGVHQGGRARERRLHQLLSSSASPKPALADRCLLPGEPIGPRRRIPSPLLHAQALRWETASFPTVNPPGTHGRFSADVLATTKAEKSAS